MVDPGRGVTPGAQQLGSLPTLRLRPPKPRPARPPVPLSPPLVWPPCRCYKLAASPGLSSQPIPAKIIMSTASLDQKLALAKRCSRGR